jgi:methylated-DNA-[protein]-cysteine S-methyltransferase
MNPVMVIFYNSMVKNSCVRLMNTPLGTLRICGDDVGVTAVEFDDIDDFCMVGDLTTPVSMCITQLREYFEGKRTAFSVPLQPEGTQFQQKVWKALQRIPFAQKVSYRYIAEQIGARSGQRAVGNANNNNPIAILIPCHRVVGADGKLVGYAGGVWRKAWLLEHETKVAADDHLVLS